MNYVGILSHGNYRKPVTYGFEADYGSIEVKDLDRYKEDTRD